VRLAHRIAGFRSLPFIIGCNPSILAVHELYIRAFHILNDFPELLNLDDVSKYSSILKTLMEDHKDVMATLAQGFKDSRKHITDEKIVSAFLDRTLCSRLGIRMLVTHHLLLQEPKAGHVGIVNLCMSLKDVAQRWANFVTDLCDEKYGHCPTFRISGHTHASFPYIEMPLDYILPEVSFGKNNLPKRNYTKKCVEERGAGHDREQPQLEGIFIASCFHCPGLKFSGLHYPHF